LNNTNIETPLSLFSADRTKECSPMADNTSFSPPGYKEKLKFIEMAFRERYEN
jgi:hypothetical protein